MSSSDGKPGEKRPLRDGIDNLKDHVTDTASTAGDAANAAVDRALDSLGTARDKAAATYASSSDTLSSGIDGNPLLALAGGLGVGLLLGALLPRTERETELYGPLGQRLTSAARQAASAAGEAGQAKFADMGFSREHARDAVRNMLEAALQAATSAGNAAVDSAKQSGRTGA